MRAHHATLLICAVAFGASIRPGDAMASPQGGSSDALYEKLAAAVPIEGSEGAEDAAITGLAAVSWLSGVYDMMQLNAKAGSTMRICPNASVQGKTMARVYMNYMDTHPETHQMPDLAVAVLSAMTAYPCPK